MAMDEVARKSRSASKNRQGGHPNIGFLAAPLMEDCALALAP